MFGATSNRRGDPTVQYKHKRNHHRNKFGQTCNHPLWKTVESLECHKTGSQNEKQIVFSDKKTHQIMVNFFKKYFNGAIFYSLYEKKTKNIRSSNEAGLTLLDIAIDCTDYN